MLNTFICSTVHVAAGPFTYREYRLLSPLMSCNSWNPPLPSIQCFLSLESSLYQKPEINNNNNNNNNDDLEIAHPQSGSSSTWFLVELEFGNVGFWGEGKTGGVPGEKPLGAMERTNNKFNPHMAGVDARIWTWATLVGSERSHHCVVPCSPFDKGPFII